VTVGSGIAPDLLTPRNLSAVRALAGSSSSLLPPVGNSAPP